MAGIILRCSDINQWELKTSSSQRTFPSIHSISPTYNGLCLTSIFSNSRSAFLSLSTHSRIFRRRESSFSHHLGFKEDRRGKGFGYKIVVRSSPPHMKISFWILPRLLSFMGGKFIAGQEKHLTMRSKKSKARIHLIA